MTKTYLLPESDRIANDVNPLLEVLADYDDSYAAAVSIGMQAALGLVAETAIDIRTKAMRASEAKGEGAAAGADSFDYIAGAFNEILEPRVEALHQTVCRAPEPVNAPASGNAVAKFLEDLTLELFGQEGLDEMLAGSAQIQRDVDAGLTSYEEQLAIAFGR